MKRLFRIGCLSIALGALSVCAGCGPRGAERGEKLAAWLEGQRYSSWFSFRRTGASPEKPASPDGITLGSPNVFAAVGCDPDDLTSLDVFWGKGRTVRPLAKPASLALRLSGWEEPIPLGDAPEQTLRRIRHTAIAVSESKVEGISVTCVSFAPMDPKLNFLGRWFIFENTGESRRRLDLVLGVTAAGEWTKLSEHSWRRGERLALVSDAAVGAKGEQIEVRVGSLSPGRRAAAALLFVAAKDEEALGDDAARAEAALPNLLGLLEETKGNWEEWCARTPLTTGDERTDDLLDSLLCLVRSHIGPEAIHTGSLRYAHDRAYVRDSYWVQRALLELGRTDEARLNLDFFHRAWAASGIASYYEIPSGAGAGYGYHGVELPHYLALMVRDAERIGGVDGLSYWDMVQGCLDQAAVPPNGLQPMNGDETWLLAAPVRELDDLLDNSWLLIASAEYGAELSARAGDGERAVRYRAMASRARGALRRFAPEPGEAEWYAAGRGGDGSLDLSLCPGVLARGAILGVLPAADPYLSAGLQTSWNRLSFERGLRAHSRSATIDGGTPGYVLCAAADCQSCNFTAELAQRVLDFASATGCVWEFHDMHDAAWGGEKRRLWDSAVVLMGLVRARFDVSRSEAGLEFAAKPESASPPPPPARPFDAEALLSESGPALILQRGSPEHAARIARELLRQRNKQYAVGGYSGEPPADTSVIIISGSNPPSGWRRNIRGYWVREWEGGPQIWVRNRGHVYADTDPLLVDLLSLLTPQRERPLPFPDANLGLASRFGEKPSGSAEVSARSGPEAQGDRLDLAGGRVKIETGGVELSAATAYNRDEGTVELKASAAGGRDREAELSITLPAGWWVVVARDMSGRWDRIGDPVRQIRLGDGRLRLVYSFPAGEDAVYLNFKMARLAVVDSQAAAR